VSGSIPGPSGTGKSQKILKKISNLRFQDFLGFRVPGGRRCCGFLKNLESPAYGPRPRSCAKLAGSKRDSCVDSEKLHISQDPRMHGHEMTEERQTVLLTLVLMRLTGRSVAGRSGRSVGDRHTNRRRRGSSSLGIGLAFIGLVLAWSRHRGRCCLLSFVFHEIDGLRQAIRRDVVLVPQLVVYYTQISLRQSVLLRFVCARMYAHGMQASERDSERAYL